MLSAEKQRKLCLNYVVLMHVDTHPKKALCYCFLISAMVTEQAATDGVSAGLETQGVVGLVFLLVACCHAISETDWSVS